MPNKTLRRPANVLALGADFQMPMNMDGQVKDFVTGWSEMSK
jgi:hypothetical protein